MEFSTVQLKRKQSLTIFFTISGGNKNLFLCSIIKRHLVDKTVMKCNKVEHYHMSSNFGRLNYQSTKKLQNIPTYERESMVIGRTKETIVVGNA